MLKRVRCVDTKDWDGYLACHAIDATSESYSSFPAEHMPAKAIAVGRNAVLATVKKIVDGPIKLTTVHHAMGAEIDIDSPAAAHAIWMCEDQFWWSRNGGTETFNGYGHYFETYEKIAGAWLIKTRRVDRLRVQHTPGFWEFLSPS